MDILAGYNGIRAAIETVKTMHDLSTSVERNRAVMDVMVSLNLAMGELFEANQARLALVKENKDLKEKLRQLEDWTAEKEKYELVDTGQGSLAYALKESERGSVPGHYLCPHCYEKGQKSMLHHETLPVGRAQTLVCHSCGYDIITRGIRQEGPPRRDRR